MATAEQVLQHVADQQSVQKLARRDLERWLKTHPEPTREELLAAVEQVIRTYGRTSSDLSVAWYDMLRRQAMAEGVYAPEAWEPGTFTVAAWERSVDNALKDPERLADRLIPDVQRWVRQWGRETVSLNARNDPDDVRFARMPVGATCAFCLMLAARGAVYRSAKGAGELNDYHNKCDCQVLPVFEDEDLPYDAAALSRKYSEARKKAGSGSLTRILAEWRRMDTTVSDYVAPKADE